MISLNYNCFPFSHFLFFRRDLLSYCIFRLVPLAPVPSRSSPINFYSDPHASWLSLGSRHINNNNKIKRNHPQQDRIKRKPNKQKKEKNESGNVTEQETYTVEVGKK